MVRAPEGVRTEAMEQLFWNRSIRRVVLLPGAGEVDLFLSPADGRAGRAPARRSEVDRGPVLVDGYGGTIALSGAKVLAASQSYTLWRQNRPARLSLYLAGRYSDGWLAGAGRMYLWPERPGEPIAKRVTLTLAALRQPRG